MAQYVYGKNVVRQLFKGDKKIYEILLVENFRDKELEGLIKKTSVNVKVVSKKKMDQILKNESHQGIAASIDDYKTYEVQDILKSIPNGKLPLLLMLDGLEDPHNLGAILRTCDCIGVDGVIIGKHRSVQLNATVAKTSTGAIDTVKVATVTNLARTIQELKEKGFWVVGADMDHAVDYRQIQCDVPLLLVVGSEGFGISSLVKKQCDYMAALPMVGQVTSLNASVACAILLYEIYSKRNPIQE